MNLSRNILIEAMLSVMEVKMGMCTEEEAHKVLDELKEKPYTIDLATTWENYLRSSFQAEFRDTACISSSQFSVIYVPYSVPKKKFCGQENDMYGAIQHLGAMVRASGETLAGCRRRSIWGNSLIGGLWRWNAAGGYSESLL